MKTNLIIFSLLLQLIISSCSAQSDSTKYHNGDIIFQTTSSSQCKAVQLATHSVYSHCGMLYFKDNQWFVFEAIGPVKFTPLTEFIEGGEGKHYVIKRVKNISQNEWKTKTETIKTFVNKELGKPYDLYFNWDDSKIYCSELVWKLYKTAFNIEVGKLQLMKDFDLSHPAVKAKLKERYGNNIPLNEQVISPARIFESDLLALIEEK